MPPYVAHWLVPVDALAAARAGSAAGDAQAQLGLSREQLAQSAEQHAAELALQRDDMMARTQQQGQALQARQQQQSAADALRQQAINQQGVLGQGRIGVEQQGVDQRSNAASAADQLRQQQIDNQAKALQERIDSSKKRQDDFSLEKYKGLQDQYQKTQQDYNTELTSSDSDPDKIKALGSQLGSLKNQMTQIEGSFAPAPAAEPSAASALTSQNTPTTPVQPVRGSVVSPQGSANPNAVAPPTGFIGRPGGSNSFVPMATDAQNGGPNALPSAAAALQTPPPQNGQAGLPDFTGKPVGAGQPAAPQVTATNPKTGQKMVLINGQWQPLNQQ